MTTLSALIATMPGITAETSDAAVLAWLSELVTVQARASANSLRAWAAAGGRRARLTRMAEPAADGSTDAVASLAQTAIDILWGAEGLDTADARLPALLDAMEAAGILVGTDRADLLACGEVSLRRDVAAGLTAAHLGDVQAARAAA